jgi:hypothetical protein
MIRPTAIIVPLVLALLAGCGVTQGVRDDVAIRDPIVKDLINKAPVRAASANVVQVVGPRLGATEVAYTKNKGLWLKQKTFSYKAPTPVPLSQLIAAIAAKGINITNDMPIDNVTFTGNVPLTDVETALRQILGSLGFDYSVDDTAKLVTIQPLATRTWTLPIRERTSNFSSNGQSGGGTQGSSGQASTGTGQSGQSAVASSQGSQSSSQGSSGQNGQSGSSSQDSGSGTGSQIGSFSAGDSPWSKLKNELDDRMFVMVPVTRSNAQQSGLSSMPTPMAGGPLPPNYGAGGQFPQQQSVADGQGSGEMYVKKRVGHFALNPSTGAVTVSAPHWILNSLDAYFRRTADALTTQISLKGILILVSKNRSNSEGLDLQNFAKWASGRYGAIISNNTLGGVTVNFGNGLIPTVTTGNATLGGPLLGIQSAPDGVQLFNNYMEQFGSTYTIQEPRIATTSGVAAQFSNFLNDSYTQISQNGSAGSTGAAVQSTTNQQIAVRTGTELNVYPTFDPVTGIVRALIISKSVVQDGVKNLPQFISTGTSSQQINQTVPLTRELKYEGEALMRDGDLIVFGGQTEEKMHTDESGLPGSNGPLGGVLGTKSATRGGGTYYFALKVSVSKL